MSGTALARIVALGSVLAKQERAAAAEAVALAADAADAADRQHLARVRCASARARGGELTAFLSGQATGAALAHAAQDASAAAVAAQQLADDALTVVQQQRVRLKAVERLAATRAADADQARARALAALVDDAVIARYARAAVTA